MWTLRLSQPSKWPSADRFASCTPWSEAERGSTPWSEAERGRRGDCRNQWDNSRLRWADENLCDLSAERDRVVDDVQVVRVERIPLDLLIVRGDERDDQDVHVGHVRFGDLLGLHGESLALGGV